MSDMGSSGVANYALTSIGQAVRTMGVVGVAGGEVNVAGPSLALDFMPDFGNVNPQLDPRITFSRASNATVTGSDGLIRFAPHNLLTFSEQFDNAAWAKSAGGVASAPVVTANAGVAPNGTTTADQVVFNLNGGSTSSDLSQIQANSVAFQAGVALTQSVYLKTTDESSKVLSFVSIDGVVELITVTGTWQRFTLTTTPTSSGSNNPLRLRLRGNENTAQSASILAWGAQLEVGSTATTYNPTTVKNLLGFSEAFDNAAWTKSNSFIQTNLIQRSEEFSSSTWAYLATTTVTANNAIAPNGSLTADTATFNVTTPIVRQLVPVSITSGTTYTLSVWVRASTASNVRLTVNNTLSWTGAASQKVALTSQWQRITLTWTANGTVAYFIIGAVDATGANDATCYGDVELWGAQLVQGSVAGDYQQTTSAALPVMYQAPNGTMTADKLVENTATSTHQTHQRPTVIAGTPYTYSIYAKAGERTKLSLDMYDGSNPIGRGLFDLSTGQVSQGIGVSSISSVGNGWYRCVLTATAVVAGSGYCQAFIAKSDYTNPTSQPSYAGDGTSGIYIWGAQLSDSASLDTYVNNPVAAPSSTAYYGPRFDYDPVTLQPRGLLIEEQRTNLLTFSEQFDNAAWTKTGSSITANATIAPNGTTTADKLVEDTANSTHGTSQLPSLTATRHTFSFYAKAAERNWLRITCVDGVAFVNLSTGVFGTVSAGTVSFTADSITSVGNGWYRVQVSFIAASGANTVLIRLTTGDGVNIYTGDGTSGAFLWGAQLEAGAFATSYIPTTSAQVTRSADVAQILGSNFSSWYNVNQGSFTVGASSRNPTNSLGLVRRADGGGTTDILFGGLNLARSNDGTTGINSNAFTSLVSGQSAKYAMSYDGSGRSVTGQGLSPVSGSYNGTYSTITSIGIASNGAGTAYLNGWIQQIAYFPRRLSNSELQAITS